MQEGATESWREATSRRKLVQGEILQAGLLAEWSALKQEVSFCSLRRDLLSLRPKWEGVPENELECRQMGSVKCVCVCARGYVCVCGRKFRGRGAVAAGDEGTGGWCGGLRCFVAAGMPSFSFSSFLHPHALAPLSLFFNSSSPPFSLSTLRSPVHQ